MAHTLDSALLAFGRFVRDHYGIPPTTREFAAALGKPSNHTAHYWLTRLSEGGLIFHGVPERHIGLHSSSDYVLTREGRIRLAEIEMGEEVTAS